MSPHLAIMAALLVLAAPFPRMLAGAVFVVAMMAIGWLLGRYLGNDKPILDVSRKPVSDETRRLVKEVVGAIADGDTSEQLGTLLRQLHGEALVEELFLGAPLDELLVALHDVGRDSIDTKEHRDQLLRLLTRVATASSDRVRMRVLGGMIKAVSRQKHVVPFLVELCKRNPDLWNDVQPSLEEAAQHEPSIKKYLDDTASPRSEFVRQSTEQYMTQMVRFRRLAEERERGDGADVDGELRALIDREFEFLKLAGTVTRRFVWLSAQAHRFFPLLDQEHLDLLLREAPTGPGEVHALLGALALAWTRNRVHETDTKKVIAALQGAAASHPSAADALLTIFQGLRVEDATDVHPEREDVRRRAYLALLDASQHSFDVIKLLGANGIPRDLYQSRSY